MILKNNRGVALLITISVVAILFAVVLEMNRKMRSKIISTSLARNRFMLSQMAISGVNAAMLLLLKDKDEPTVDSVQEDWANPEELATLVESLSFDDGAITLKISDELAKIQINSLVQFPEGKNFQDPQRNMLHRFLQMLLASNELEDLDIEPAAILNCIKDWLDFGDDDLVTDISGAESLYYQGLEPPYPCKNGTIKHINELNYIKNIGEVLRNLPEDQIDLADYITPYGMSVESSGKYTFSGKININTASPQIISVLLPMEYAFLAQDIADYRLEKSDDNYVNDLTKNTWYKDVPGCSDVTIDPEILTLSSNLFRIESRATFLKMNVHATAVVERIQKNPNDKWNCRLLSLQLE